MSNEHSFLSGAYSKILKWSTVAELHRDQLTWFTPSSVFAQKSEEFCIVMMCYHSLFCISPVFTLIPLKNTFKKIPLKRENYQYTPNCCLHKAMWKTSAWILFLHFLLKQSCREEAEVEKCNKNLFIIL